MNKLIVSFVMAGLLVGSMLFAQDNGRRNRNQNRSGGRPPMQQRSEENAKKWADVQSQLKKKYPEKFAEIEKLAQTNIAEAMQKMTQLAREAKIATPFQRGGFGGREGFGGRDGGRDGGREGFGGRGGFGGRDGGFGGRGGFGGGREGFGNRGGFGGGQGGQFGGMMGNRQRREAEAQIKAKFPKEYAEIDKAQEQAEAKLQELAKKAEIKLPLTQEAMMKKMAAVREKYKAEFEEIAKLRETDPQAARERTQEIYKREGIEMPPMMNFRRPDQRGREDGDRPQARRGNQMQDIQKKMKDMQNAYPEEMKKIQALRQENPQQFRSELRKLAERYDREHPTKK